MLHIGSYLLTLEEIPGADFMGKGGWEEHFLYICIGPQVVNHIQPRKAAGGH